MKAACCAESLTYGEYSIISKKRELQNKREIVGCIVSSAGCSQVWRAVRREGEYRPVNFVDNVDNFVGKFL